MRIAKLVSLCGMNKQNDAEQFKQFILYDIADTCEILVMFDMIEILLLR